eukprot:snap_masked-scaffold_17-processed-gene-4.21-mRNA-1 protein AED:1.00 eAED:1.00 QI:0/-1/0/0/-1/1/1/0/564
MKHIPFLFLLISRLNATAQVPTITSNFTYITTRYSNFIGNFDTDCIISAPMIKLQDSENLCDLNTIETNVTGYVLVTFVMLNYDCYEEKAYENAMELGAVAVVDAVAVPPGSFHSVHNLEQKFKFGNVPFVQVGTEFFGTFGIEGKSIGFDFLVETYIEINGCGDESGITECFEIYQKIYICFSFVAMFGLILAYKLVKKIRWNVTSKPRIFLLAIESVVLLLSAFILFFGLELRLAKNLLDGSVISAQVKDVLGILQLIGNIHSSLMNAIYWNALKKGCFSKASRSLEYWKNEFFFSPWQIIALLLTSSLTFGLVRLVDNFYLGKIDQFKRLLQFAVSIDIICGIVLVFSMLRFILTLRTVVSEFQNTTYISKQDNWLNKTKYIWKSIKAILKGDYKSLKPKNISGVDEKLINLSLHLSKWLFLYVCIMILSCSFLLFGFFENLTFGLLQNDPKMCKGFSFFVAYICTKIFTSYCKIIGLGGPSQKNIKVETVEHYFNTNRFDQSPYGFSSSGKTPPSPFFTTPGLADYSRYQKGKEEKRNGGNNGEKEVSLVSVLEQVSVVE